jgi:hypothetical protein
VPSPRDVAHSETPASIETTLPTISATPVKRFDASGFSEAPGKNQVIANCTGCHSGRLVQQNRATWAGWHEIIRWMQAKQGFWPLEASAERQILDYLAAEYGPDRDKDDGRRPGLAPHLLPPAAALQFWTEGESG